MRHSSSSLEALHRLTSRHRATLKDTTQCGCFYCMKTFTVGDITRWIGEGPGKDDTAACPFCDIDSVLPARDGAPIDQDVLRAMHAYWFTGGVSMPEKPTAMSALRMRINPLLRRLRWDLWQSRKDLM